MRFCLIFLLTILGSQSIGGKVTAVDVFWIPPEVQTYTPITADNIERAAFKIVHIRDDDQAEKVIRLIQNSKQMSDSKLIRVKISFGSQFYNFDRDGIGISSTGDRVQIDLNKLKAVLCE
jgi:hypothetical protein